MIDILIFKLVLTFPILAGIQPDQFRDWMDLGRNLVEEEGTATTTQNSTSNEILARPDSTVSVSVINAEDSMVVEVNHQADDRAGVNVQPCLVDQETIHSRIEEAIIGGVIDVAVNVVVRPTGRLGEPVAIVVA